MQAKQKPKFIPVNVEQRQMEAAKINRLRALRLAKEAADQEAAAATAAADQSRKPAKRVRT